MEDHYGIADLRQLISGGRPHFGGISPPAPLLLQQQRDFFSGHHQLTQPPPYQPQHMYDLLMTSSSSRHQQPLMSSHDHHFRLNINNSPTSRASPRDGGSSGGVTVTGATCSGALSAAGLDSTDQLGGGDCGNGRWPRQETLTLLEIRSCLDTKFKEANQKGPLWDEVSRIMSEEHGYQRSGKKCREKFENLYKYYKKTKEGKAGRQDGKHYRFFRQLEALYGETSLPPTTTTITNSNNFIASSSSSLQYHSRSNSNNNNNNRSNGNIQVDHNHQDQAFHSHNSLSLSYSSSGFDSSSSDDNDLNTTAYMENDLIEKRRKRRRNWKAKIKDFIDSQMKKLVEKQEAWMEKMMRTIESREQERILREEEWRKNVAQRLEREHKFWASERAWIEARGAALLEAIGNISGRDHNNLRANSTRALNSNDNNIIHEDGSDVVPDNDGIGKQQGDCSWQESEITRLVQLRASMEMQFEQMGCSEDILWEEIAARMACLGYDKSPLMCKSKWDSLNHCLRRNNNNNAHQDSSFRFFTNGL